MTMDDGCAGNGYVEESFGGRINALALARKLSVREAAQRAGLDMATLTRAIELGSSGLPESEMILQRLLCEYGVELPYLLGDLAAQGTEIEILRRRVYNAVMMFIDQKKGTPEALSSDDRRRLFAEVEYKIKSMPRHSDRLAADAGVPTTAIEVAWLWARMNRD